jgi:hypothetical protein
MEHADLKAPHLVEAVYRDSGRGVKPDRLLSEEAGASNNFGRPAAA